MPSKHRATPLNDAFVASQATRSSDRSGAPETRLRGRKLILARVVWGAAVILIVVSFLAKLLANSTFLQTICTGATCGLGQPTLDSAHALQKLGLSVATYATSTLALTLALLTNVVAVLGSGVYVLVLALFPDGRFVPRWTRWLLLCWALSGMVVPFFPEAFFGWPLYNLLWRAELVLLLIAQVSRSRTASSPLQRQQGKWLLYGGSVAVLIIVGITVPTLLFPSLGQAGSFYQLVITPAYVVISFTLPLCIGLAILRYRLWEIDVLIRRTLVYSTLTVIVALLYVGLVFVFGSLVRAFLGQQQNPLVIVTSTLVIAALFQPLRHGVQRVIDRRFYRRRYDAAKTLEAFSTTLRNEVDLEQLREKLVAVVTETMQPSHVSLWLPPANPASKQPTAWSSPPPAP